MNRGASLGLIVVCRVVAVWVLTLASGVQAEGARAAEAQAGLPTGVCMAGFCGPAQRRIWTRFEQGEGLDGAMVPGVYAGVCYVHDDLYDPDREHHVGFLIDETGGRPRLFLRFSFFAAANPYDGLDVDAARLRLVNAVLPVSMYESHAYADYADMGFFSRYWFRREPATGRVLLVSYFGYRMTIICDAVENAA